MSYKKNQTVVMKGKISNAY